MKALWLRVDAHKVDSREVGELADALGIDVVQALGHVVALGGAVAEHTDDGMINDVADSTLERWARWSGKRGAFAPVLRHALQSDNGEYDNWHEEMGQLVERRTRDRNRKRTGDSEEDARKARGNSTETGRESAATERNGTERDVTGRSARSTTLTTPISGAENYTGTLSRARELPAPLADATAEEPEQHRDAIAAWLDEYYPDDNRRRADVVRQLLASLNGGASLARGEIVRAFSVARLAEKCNEIRHEGVHKADKAIVVLLKKLGDTTDIAAQQRRQAREQLEADETANAGELRTALTWLEAHPSITAVIDAQLDADYPDGDHGVFATARRIARNELVRAAYRASLDSLTSPEEVAHA